MDVGTSTVSTVIAERRRGEERLHVLGLGIVPVAGMRRGIVVDIEDVTAAIRRSVEEARRASGAMVRGVWLAVDGAHIAVSSSRGVVAVSRADGEITEEDVRRALAAAETFIPKNPNKAVLHMIPRDFRVDNEAGIKDPVGMHGIRLEVDALIIDCSRPFLKNLLKCVEAAGLLVRDYVFSPLAAAEIVLTKRQRELGTMLVDIGSGTTSFIVFEEGVPIHAGVLPIGGGHITNDIAIGFRTHVDVAEYLKTLHGSCVSQDLPKREAIRLADVLEEHAEDFSLERGLLLSEQHLVYSRRELAEIIEARQRDIFDLLQKELRKIGRSQLLPGGVVLIGGASRLPGLVELTRREMKLPAEIGAPQEYVHALDERSAPSLAAVFGVLKWADSGSGVQTRSDWKTRLTGAGGKRVLEWFRSLIP